VLGVLIGACIMGVIKNGLCYAGLLVLADRDHRIIIVLAAVLDRAKKGLDVAALFSRCGTVEVLPGRRALDDVSFSVDPARSSASWARTARASRP